MGDCPGGAAQSNPGVPRPRIVVGLRRALIAGEAKVSSNWTGSVASLFD
jgi:hypothetical protein